MAGAGGLGRLRAAATPSAVGSGRWLHPTTSPSSRPRPRSYASPPRRPERVAGRPARARWWAGQPRGETGSAVQGPDQGYAFKLRPHVRRQAAPDRRRASEDAEAGCRRRRAEAGVALRAGTGDPRPDVALHRVGLPRRAPPAELVELRATLFEGVANPHHYPEQRAVVDAVPESTLRLTPARSSSAHGPTGGPCSTVWADRHRPARQATGRSEARPVPW